MSSVDARELGCWSLFQVGALGMTELLKSGRSTAAWGNVQVTCNSCHE